VEEMIEREGMYVYDSFGYKGGNLVIGITQRRTSSHPHPNSFLMNF